MCCGKEHGTGSSTIGALNNAADVFVRVVLGLVVIAFAGTIWAILKDVLIAVGSLVVGLVAGYIGVKIWLAKRRRMMALLAGQAQPALPLWAQRRMLPQQPQALPQALPQTVNQSLALPANLTGDETIRVLREMRDGR